MPPFRHCATVDPDLRIRSSRKRQIQPKFRMQHVERKAFELGSPPETLVLGAKGSAMIGSRQVALCLEVSFILTLVAAINRAG